VVRGAAAGPAERIKQQEPDTRQLLRPARQIELDRKVIDMFIDRIIDRSWEPPHDE